MRNRLVGVESTGSSRQTESLPTEHDSQISAIGYLLARGNWNKET